MLPLEGITVISLEQAVAAPFATRQLADLGARVIKIERPGTGDFARHYDETVKGMSSHFVWINRSKESLTLDLKSDDGKEILKSLLAKADVFIHNLAPGATDRLGFGTETIKKEYPALSVCSISGYGTYGPYLEKKAYDLLIQCEAGLVSITGTEDTPSKAGISIADIAAGMYAFTGILTALISRFKTGKGSIMEISMLEALGEWMGFPLYYSKYGGSDPKRAGASHATIYPYGPFPSADNKPVFLSIQNEREWVRFCEEVLLQPELASDPRFSKGDKRSENKEELGSIIDFEFTKLKAETIIDRLQNSKIANARLNTIAEFADHPQLKARNRWKNVDSPAGPIEALIPPVTFEEIKHVMNPIPEVGEHTDRILKELGYSEEAINRLKEERTI